MWKYMMQAGEEYIKATLEQATLDQSRRSPIPISRAGRQRGRVAM
jgi:hypothetical protein